MCIYLSSDDQKAYKDQTSITEHLNRPELLEKWLILGTQEPISKGSHWPKMEELSPLMTIIEMIQTHQICLTLRIMIFLKKLVTFKKMIENQLIILKTIKSKKTSRICPAFPL